MPNMPHLTDLRQRLQVIPLQQLRRRQPPPQHVHRDQKLQNVAHVDVVVPVAESLGLLQGSSRIPLQGVAEGLWM